MVKNNFHVYLFTNHIYFAHIFVSLGWKVCRVQINHICISLPDLLPTATTSPSVCSSEPRLGGKLDFLHLHCFWLNCLLTVSAGSLCLCHLAQTLLRFLNY